MGWFDYLLPRRHAAVSDALWQRGLGQLAFLQRLSIPEQNKLRKLVNCFLQEKEFSSAGGLQLTDEICLSIAIQGCLPILHLGLSAYRDWIEIVVYPDEFVVARQIEDEDGIVHEYDDVISGEAWDGGPLIISWRDVQQAGSGYNVVIHEFAHKLDMLNGAADGIPALHSGLTLEEWKNTLLAAYSDFCQRLEKGEETAIDPYASEDPAEFFAVLSESYFEQPAAVDREYPAFFALLQRYYQPGRIKKILPQTEL